MGGKKKLSLKQIERSQDKKPEKEKKTGKSAGPPDKKVAGITSPDSRSDKIVGELKKMKVLTPYSVATRFDLRLSVAGHAATQPFGFTGVHPGRRPKN